ncbi:APH domain-containing protein [Mycena venus]|uniref:APH domain-containing protein n=1 Tax=Mycena venus TaxID=2733690 RepID=A0A8H7CZC9_9AGAR|nr:APH domain-containing protein [Mycena venus]
MSFDFPSYLASQLSLKPVDFQVDVLAGGLTNVTVRATFATPISVSKSQPFTSVVLKYAPPYIASDPTQAMSVHRQVIEANALRYLAETPEIRDLLQQFLILKIPHLIHHDATANVLWITDLGASQTLFKYLTMPPPIATVLEVAATLGTFISDLWKITAHPTPETIALFTRPIEQDNPVIFLASTALQVMSSRGVSDAEVLSDRVRTTMQTKEKLEPCLSMVDFWPGSILIGPDGSCGLVDWEYFGPSTPGAEIGMLVAHLHLIIAQSGSKPDVCDTTRTFISAFLDSYGAHAPPASTYFKRQALIAYGREMVTAIEFFAADWDESARKRVLDAGVRSLRAADGSEAEVNVKLDDTGAILWDDILQ